MKPEMARIVRSRRKAAIRDDGPETTAGKGSRWQRSSPTSCGSSWSCDRRRSRHQSACSAVSGHRPTVEGWGPAQSRCRKGLRRSLAGVPCALDTRWVVQMAVLDHVLGERGVIETWPSSRRRWVRHQSFRPAPYGNSSLGREPQRVSAVDAAEAEVFDLRQLLARFRGR